MFEPHSLYSIFAHSTFYSIWLWAPSLFQTLTFASKIRLIWVIFQHCESLRMMNIWSLFTNKSKGKSAPFLEQRLLKNALAKSNFALCFKALEWPNCNWHFLLYPRNFSISKRWNNCQLFYKNAWCGAGSVFSAASLLFWKIAAFEHL